eukprot:gnl/Dysnectes_brevis/5256_a7478_494.p1 GENE.gnl/Dysnectes_brevis/5256_a7478_494~~gnl/Dysnectes_brevis/5256_a7478_494.p1  ORF type:complete len:768 (+),score=155.41 gnl/Dysnectes_brevis/5256_a7478_494:33-2336(+)
MTSPLKMSQLYNTSPKTTSSSSTTVLSFLSFEEPRFKFSGRSSKIPIGPKHLFWPMISDISAIGGPSTSIDSSPEETITFPTTLLLAIPPPPPPPAQPVRKVIPALFAPIASGLRLLSPSEGYSPHQLADTLFPHTDDTVICKGSKGGGRVRFARVLDRSQFDELMEWILSLGSPPLLSTPSFLPQAIDAVITIQRRVVPASTARPLKVRTHIKLGRRGIGGRDRHLKHYCLAGTPGSDVTPYITGESPPQVFTVQRAPNLDRFMLQIVDSLAWIGEIAEVALDFIRTEAGWQCIGCKAVRFSFTEQGPTMRWAAMLPPIRVPGSTPAPAARTPTSQPSYLHCCLCGERMPKGRDPKALPGDFATAAEQLKSRGEPPPPSLLRASALPPFQPKPICPACRAVVVAEQRLSKVASAWSSALSPPAGSLPVDPTGLESSSTVLASSLLRSGGDHKMYRMGIFIGCIMSSETLPERGITGPYCSAADMGQSMRDMDLRAGRVYLEFDFFGHKQSINVSAELRRWKDGDTSEIVINRFISVSVLATEDALMACFSKQPLLMRLVGITTFPVFHPKGNHSHNTCYSTPLQKGRFSTVLGYFRMPLSAVFPTAEETWGANETKVFSPSLFEISSHPFSASLPSLTTDTPSHSKAHILGAIGAVPLAAARIQGLKASRLGSHHTLRVSQITGGSDLFSHSPGKQPPVWCLPGGTASLETLPADASGYDWLGSIEHIMRKYTEPVPPPCSESEVREGSPDSTGQAANQAAEESLE